MTLHILKNDRPVPGELEFGFEGIFTLDRNEFTDGCHLPPATRVAVAGWVFRVGLIDIQILLVRRKDGQTPGAKIVMPDRNSRQGRLSSAYDIPPRCGKMNPIAERGDLKGSMWIVRQER